MFTVTFLFFLCVLSYVDISWADLPIHAVTSQVSNPINSMEFWRFSLTSTHKERQLCGGGLPTQNTDIQNTDVKNYPKWLENNMGGYHETIDIVLTLTRDAPTLATVLSNNYVGVHGDQCFNALATSKHQHRQQWLTLGVRDSSFREKIIGGWTMVYDEGFEVYVARRKSSCNNCTTQQHPTSMASAFLTINSPQKKTPDSAETPFSCGSDCEILVFFGFLDYNLNENTETHRENHVCNLHSATNGESEDSNGKTLCYKTDPSRTSIGWYQTQSGDELGTEHRRYGCFWGKKLFQVTKSHEENFSYPSFMKMYTSRSVDAQPDSTRRATGFNLNERLKSHIPLKQYRSILHRSTRMADRDPVTKQASNSTGGKSTLYPCNNTDSTKKPQDNTQKWPLPRHYSAVLNPFATAIDKARLTGWVEPPVRRQGECGSCYSIAATYVLEQRVKLFFRELLHCWKTSASLLRSLTTDLRFPELSPQSVVSCSYYNQGCNGGYPYLVAKWAQEYGIPFESVMPYIQNGATQCSLIRRSFSPGSDTDVLPRRSADRDIVFSRGYGYVGGCYECCSERAMLEEIFFEGPIIGAFEVHDNIRLYNTGIFVDLDEPHAGMCDAPMTNLNGWEYTSHAVSIVGWGEQPDSTGQGIVKYWIAKNSWGTDWGKDGFFKILRGHNMQGIESQAVYLDPDFHRGYPREVINDMPPTRSRRTPIKTEQVITTHNFEGPTPP